MKPEGIFAREVRLARAAIWLERWRKTLERQHGATTWSRLKVPWNYTLHVSLPTPNGPAVMDVTARADFVKAHVEELFGFLDGSRQLPDGSWSYDETHGWRKHD